ncbi:MAG TPA: VanW family protein [Candidatus Limiplasma sp.]|nr:VanW family protein [Candidatus Limiplasma sp.]HPS81886.1 VanW family protein [Candidatus Limiplasma sp.]
MAWEDQDPLNDPAFYTPRNSPSVQKLGQQEPARAPSPADSEYLFDEDETWDEALEALPTLDRQSAGYAQDAANPYARRSAKPLPGAKPAQTGGFLGIRDTGNGNPIVYASVIAGCLAILIVIFVMMMPQMAGYFWKDLDNFAFINGEVLRYDSKLVANYKQYRDYLQQDMIYQGVFVDGVHVGGMTVAQAEIALQASDSSTAGAFSVNIVIGNKSWTLDNTNVTATRTLENVLQQAYAVGRQNTTEIIGTNRTPFRERVDTVLNLLENYRYLRSEATYDHDAVKQRIAEITAYVTRDPVNSQIESFNPNTRTFTFTDDQAGVTIDSDALYNEVIAKLDQGAVGDTINVTAQITTPSITKADMMNNFKMVAAYTTNTTSDKSRNNNISLACQAINGKALMPGETFSFNQSTGERTTDKGYQSAGAIAAGQSIEEVGGGICQVSSTLFNAVARADLEIVSRSPHAWPSTYVNYGEDATVNWPNLDFKFKNNKTTPVFVLAYYKDRKCSAEIWGMTLGTGVTIDLDSKIVKTIEPPSDVLYKQNTSLPAGTSAETVKAHTGYVVETYKVWYKDGQEVKRELMQTSTYKAYQRTIEYN